LSSSNPLSHFDKVTIHVGIFSFVKIVFQNFVLIPTADLAEQNHNYLVDFEGLSQIDKRFFSLIILKPKQNYLLFKKNQKKF